MYVFVSSYLIGGFPIDWFRKLIPREDRSESSRMVLSVRLYAPRWASKADGWTFVGESFKALACLLIARQFVGTPVSSVIASFGVIWGSMWPPYSPNFMIYRGFGAMATCLFLLSPPSFLIVSAIWFVAFASRRSVYGATVLAASILPITMFFFQKPDILVIFGILISISLIYRCLDEVEKLASMDATGYGPVTYGIGGRYIDVLPLHLYCGTQLSEYSPLMPRIRTIRSVRVGLQAVALVSLALLTIVLFYTTRYVYHGIGTNIDLFRAGSPHFKVVALTFDDGPDPKYTPEILDVLDRYHVKATFFMVGRHVRKHPDLAKRVAEQGHEIGNHTYSHLNLFEARPEVVEREISECDDIISEVTGTSPRLFRPPRGLSTPGAFRMAQLLRHTVVLWSNSSEDWAEISVRDITRNVIERVKSGDLILFHDSGDLIRESGGTRINTVKALPAIIEDLQARGFSFVTVTQMMILSGLAGEELEQQRDEVATADDESHVGGLHPVGGAHRGDAAYPAERGGSRGS